MAVSQTRGMPAVDDRPDQPDADLAAELEAAAEGDEAAWRAIVARYARRVFALARSRVRRADLAEEITQSVFVTVASKLSGRCAGERDDSGKYTEQGRFEAWLFRIAVNRIRDEVRRLRRHAAPTDPETLDHARAAPSDAPASVSPELEALRDAMVHLSPQDREVIELRHHAGMSFNQMAEVLGEPLGTLLARHHRALRKLRDRLTASVPDGTIR